MKYQCTDRVPPDCTGRMYYEGEVYDLSQDEIDKLTVGGHMGAKYDGQTVEPHFVKMGEDGVTPEPAPQADGLEELTVVQLKDIAGELKISIPAGTPKADLVELIRLARAGA